MKRIIYLLLLFPFICFGQVPQGVNYQAVAYDANGFELSNKEVGVRISIVEGSAFGTPQLVEEHDVITTEQGLFSIIIGQGALLGGEAESLLDIPWGANTYFLKIELDVENNGSYMDFGTQQFMSVPYALYAESSGTPGPEGPEGPQGDPADPIDYDSLTDILANDSTLIANVQGESDSNGSISSTFINMAASHDYSFPTGGNSGGVGSYSESVGELFIPANTIVEIFVSYSTSISGYGSGLNFDIDIVDSYDSSPLEFIISTDEGISFSNGVGLGCSDGHLSNSGGTNLNCSDFFVMKKVFTNEANIIINYSSSASTIAYAWCNSCGGSGNSVQLGISLITFD